MLNWTIVNKAGSKIRKNYISEYFIELKTKELDVNGNYYVKIRNSAEFLGENVSYDTNTKVTTFKHNNDLQI